MQHVFISHSTLDDTVVAAIRTALEGLQIDGWTDSERVAAGVELTPAITAAIQDAAHFIVVISQRAMDSEWVQKEVNLAKQVRHQRTADGGDYRIIPILLDGIRPNVLNAWLEEEIVCIETGDSELSLPEAMAQLIATLQPGLNATEDREAIASLNWPLSDLTLELSNPSVNTVDGARQLTADAKLTWRKLPACDPPAPAPSNNPHRQSDTFTFTNPLSLIEAEELRWYLESYFRWPSDVFQKRATHVEEQIPEWGQQLFASVTRGVSVPLAKANQSAAELFRTWHRDQENVLRRFTVHVRPDDSHESRTAATSIMTQPWELLHDGRGFLFMGRKAVRVRRRLPEAEPHDIQPIPPPIRILLVTARPEADGTAYINHRESAAPLVDALDPLGDLAQLTVLDPPTFPALVAELLRAADASQPYHVVHFDGHGVYDKQHGLGKLCFEQPVTQGVGSLFRLDGIGSTGDARPKKTPDPGALYQKRQTHKVSAIELGERLRDYDLPLFFLEACQTGQAEDDITASVAGSLLASGVSSVVAMSHSVLVETAKRFVTVFYKKLMQGRRIGEAMLAGQRALEADKRRGLSFNGELHLHDWFVPVLYQEHDDPVLVQRVGSAKLKAVAQRAREIALGDLPPAPEHSFVGRSRELLAVERAICGTRHTPDHGSGDLPEELPYAVILGEGGEGKTTLTVELARWLVRTRRFAQAAFITVEHNADLHAVLGSLGRQLIGQSRYVAEAKDDATGRRLIEAALKRRRTLLVVDNLESIVSGVSFQLAGGLGGGPGSGGSKFNEAAQTVGQQETSMAASLNFEPPDPSPSKPAEPQETSTAASLNFEPPDPSPSNTANDVLTPLFDLLSGLNNIADTRILFTTRTPLPEPFAGHHVRIDRLSTSDAVELVGNVLRTTHRRPRAGDSGETDDDIKQLVESVHCHARSLVLLSRQVADSGVRATTENLRELMQQLHAQHGDNRECSLFASVELSLRRLPPDIRAKLPPLSVFHGGFRPQELAKVLNANMQSELAELDMEALMRKLSEQGEPANEAEMMERMQQIPELAALMGGVSSSVEDAAAIARQLIEVGLAEPQSQNHVRLHPALGPYLASELTGDARQASKSAWMESMRRLTEFLYRQAAGGQDPKSTVELTLLELPNLVAALESRWAECGAGFQPADDAETARHELTPQDMAGCKPAPREAIAAIESVIDMATNIEGLLQNLHRPQSMAIASSTRAAAANLLVSLHRDNPWSHSQFQAADAHVDRLLDSGHFSEAAESATELLSQAAQAGESAYPGAAYDLAMANFTLGRALKMSGSAQSALEPLSEARTRFDRLANAGNQDAARMASAALTETADCLRNLGRLNDAAAMYEQAIELAEARNDLRDVATGKGQLGKVRLLQRRYPEALAAQEKARQTFEQLEEPSSVATAWHLIGDVHTESKQYEAAEHAYQQSLQINTALSNRSVEAMTLNQLGNLYSRMSRLEESVTMYKRAADIYLENGNALGEGRARSNMADKLVKLSRPADARREILRAIECKQPYGHAAQPWMAFNILSNLEQSEGNASAAAEACGKAIAAYLAYRRDGGEDMTGNIGPQLCALVTAALLTDQVTLDEANSQVESLAQHPDLPNHPDLQLIIPALQSILSGSRDPNLATDPRLNYADVAELQLLLERLSAHESSSPAAPASE